MRNTQNKFELPDFTLTSIYDDSLVVNYVMMPIGVTFDFIKNGASSVMGFLKEGVLAYRSNEKDPDKYSDFFITAADLVDKKNLPSWQLKRFERARFLQGNGDSICVLTLISDLPKNELKERQVFVGAKTLEGMGLELPKKDKQVGDNTKVLVNSLLDCKIYGQYWGWSRPRATSVTMKEAQEELLNRVNSKLKDPETIVRRGPLPFFAAPIAVVKAAVLIPVVNFMATAFKGPGPL